MITSKPALWNSITPILDDVTMIAHENESAAVWEVDLHANEAISVTRQVVQCDALTEVQRSLVECLPIAVAVSVLPGISNAYSYVQVKLHVVLQIHANICTCGNGPESRSQLQIVYPNFDILNIDQYRYLMQTYSKLKSRAILTFLSKKRSRPPA